MGQFEPGRPIGPIGNKVGEDPCPRLFDRLMVTIVLGARRVLDSLGLWPAMS